MLYPALSPEHVYRISRPAEGDAGEAEANTDSITISDEDGTDADDPILFDIVPLAPLRLRT